MRYAGFLFDMDGTMIDNMMVHHRAWQLKLQELGLEMSLEQVRKEIHGKNEEIFARLFGDRFTSAERLQHAQDKEARYRTVFRDEIKLIDGCADFLRQAKERGIPMAVGTAAPPENVVFSVEATGIAPYFGSIIHAGMVTAGKPDPQVFHMAAEGIGLTASDCLVFEDSPTGVQTALNAGADAVVITTSHTREEFAHFPNVIRFITDFRDPWLQSLFEG